MPFRVTNRFFRLGACLCVSTLTAPATAQPFNTLINIPSDPAPDSIGSDTQLNLFDGGVIELSFNAGNPDGSSTNVEVNINGGLVKRNFDSYAGSTINIRGGVMVNGARAFPGSTINLSGGLMGDTVEALPGGHVNISGGEFFLNGLPVPGLDLFGDSASVNLPLGSYLTVTLADGTIRNFRHNIYRGNIFPDGTLTLVLAPLPTAPSLVNVPWDPVPQGLRAGQTLNLIDGGELGIYFTALGSTVNINGGTVGRNFIAEVGSTININGGNVGGNFDAFTGSTVNISGGNVGGSFNANPGSTVNLSGGEFFLDGVPVPGLASVGDSTGVNTPDGSNLIVTLADGTIRAFGAAVYDRIADGTLNLIRTPLPAVPGVVNVPADLAPQGLRTGQTLNLVDGGELGSNFTAAPGTTINIAGGDVGIQFNVFSGSTVNLSGGQVGSSFQANSGTTVHITGGSVGDGFTVKSGSTVNISGGSIGEYFAPEDGSTINISDGSIGRFFSPEDGSTVNISGGSIGDFPLFYNNSTINLSGGTVGTNIYASDGTLNLIGLSFILDGIDLFAELPLGQPLLITDRDVVLEGILADGSVFSFGLNSVSEFGKDYFDGVTLTITRVPEPATLALLGLGSLCVWRRRPMN